MAWFRTVPTPDLTRPHLNRLTSCLGRKGQVAILEIVRSDVTQTKTSQCAFHRHKLQLPHVRWFGNFEGELSGVLMERICRQWAEWWQMTSSSFVSPLDCLTSFLGISLSRAVSTFGLPVYSSIHSRRITNAQKLSITSEMNIRSWRKPPEIPEEFRMHLICESFAGCDPVVVCACHYVQMRCVLCRPYCCG